MAKKALVGGGTDLCPFYLTCACLAPQLPGQLAHLGNGLGQNRLAKA